MLNIATLNRWLIEYSSSLALAAKKSKRAVASSWRMDEITVKVKAPWFYLYHAVDIFGDTDGFMLSEHRDEAAATAFFKQAIDVNGFPGIVVMDKSAANYALTGNIIFLLMLAGLISFVEILRINYLNKLIEPDHRFIKKITHPMMVFKAFHSTQATLDGIETAYVIRKGDNCLIKINTLISRLWL